MLAVSLHCLQFVETAVWVKRFVKYNKYAGDLGTLWSWYILFFGFGAFIWYFCTRDFNNFRSKYYGALVGLYELMICKWLVLGVLELFRFQVFACGFLLLVPSL